MVLLQGFKHEKRPQSEVQHCQLLETGQSLQLRHEGFSVLGKSCELVTNRLVQIRRRHTVQSQQREKEGQQDVFHSFFYVYILRKRGQRVFCVFYSLYSFRSPQRSP